jgi:hypothetical protein
MSGVFDFVNGPAGRFALKQGTTFLQTLRELDDVGAPTSFVGFTGVMQAKRTADGDPLFTLTTENAGLVIRGASGEIDIAITAAASAEFPAGIYFYDLIMQAADGSKQPFLEGRFEVSLNWAEA